VTMHVVLGDGEMPKKALTETLQDLWERAEADQQSFWFLVKASDEPTTTERHLMGWIAENEIYFEMISDGSAVDDIYDGAQAKHTAKRLAPKIVNLMKSQPEEDEDADVLALFVSDEADAEEDLWLNETIQATTDAGFKTYALNDGLMEVELGAVEQPEPEETPPPAKKAAAKKVAAKKAAPLKRTAVGPVDAETGEIQDEITREFLENQTLDTLKELAANRGIELPPRTRSQTYIDAILGEGEELAEAEVDLPKTPDEIQDDTTMIAPAILVVVYDNTVTSKMITVSEAEAILGL
jgi:hypothetical protein